MSDLKQISPMLDNFAVGGAISSHHGVRCYPAMENDFDGKYIIKVVSVPASQTQLDALLLTGAYSSLDAALAYFKEIADEVINEAQFLDKLSHLEGFLPYRSFQCERKEDGSGYDVYLLSPYRRTLTRQFMRAPLSHLDAVNLGLDICAALTVCRNSGYLYVDLKPNNIYVTNDKSFYIGDLGFLDLGSLKYASLPDRYHSEYTAPEISDAFSALNTTLDTYALGMILYQVYNNGVLPAPPENGVINPPEYADYEMSEIILKAIAIDPAQRWEDPVQMGQALVSYMQRNGANDVPIIPAAPIIQDTVPDHTNDAAEVVSENAVQASDDTVILGNPLSQSGDTAEDGTLNLNPVQEAVVVIVDAEPVQTLEPDDSPETQHGSVISDDVDVEADEDSDEYINLSFLDDDYIQDISDINDVEVTDEVSDILALADELVSHPVPESVIPPDPIEVPVPEPVVLDDELSEDTQPTEEKQQDVSSSEIPDQEQFVLDADTQTQAEDPAVSGNAEEDPESVSSNKSAKKTPVWLRILIVLLILAVLLGGGYYYYQNYYLQNIDSVSVSGSEDKLVVRVDTAADQRLLSVVCADPHGNKIPAAVVDGQAHFENLLPNTAYTVSIEISGFHDLTGNTTTTYSTPIQTNIVQFNAVTGSENGSAILSFTIEGPDSEKWSVSYGTDGEDTALASFTGHTVVLNGLTVGKDYTFTLIPQEDLYITGTDQLVHRAKNLVYAQNLTILSCADGVLTASWSSPDDVSVNNWIVRCTGENYSESLVTEEEIIRFEGLDHTASYTVEVIAEGMSVSQRAIVAENSVTLSDFTFDDSIPNQLVLSWNANSEPHQEGWIVDILANGAEVYPPAICTENQVVLNNLLPNMVHSFSFRDLNGTQFLGLPATFTTPEAPVFSCNYSNRQVTADDITFRMCKTPDEYGWNFYDVYDEDYRTSYSIGERASFTMRINKSYGRSLDRITTMIAISDANGNPVSVDCVTNTWNSMWYNSNGEIDIPRLPSAQGDYVISIYFNGAIVHTENFTMV